MSAYFVLLESYTTSKGAVDDLEDVLCGLIFWISLQTFENKNKFNVVFVFYVTLDYSCIVFLSVFTLYPIHFTSFRRINYRQLLKTLREKKKLLVTSNFSFFHYVFYSVRYLHLHLFTFLTSYLYLQLIWITTKLPYEIKGEN